MKGMVSEMNLPNQITLGRVILVPIFVIVMLVDSIPYNDFIACAIFCIACLSDFVDGYLARKWHLVTNFGKFADPLADKLLVSAALICLVELERLPAWVVILIISREFIISGLRLIAVDNGVVIAANYWGKAKTVVQMFTCIFLIVNFGNDIINIVEEVLIWGSVALTVISLVEYMYANRKVLSDGGTK